MERRSERLLNHQPCFRTFEYGAEDDRRKRNADRMRKSREQESEKCKRKRLDNNAAQTASSRERESEESRRTRLDAVAAQVASSRELETSIERHSRLQTNAIRMAASRAAAHHVDAAQSATTGDARRYAAQIENTCVFHMCCVCSYEGGNHELHLLTDEIKEQLRASPLASRYRALTDNSSPFALCAASELDFPGVLRGVDRICKQCAQDAGKENAAPSTRKRLFLW